MWCTASELGLKDQWSRYHPPSWKVAWSRWVKLAVTHEKSRSSQSLVRRRTGRIFYEGLTPFPRYDATTSHSRDQSTLTGAAKKVERFVFSCRARHVWSANSRLIGSSRNQRNLLCSVNFDLLIENECKWALYTLFLKSCNANIIAWITLPPPWFSLHTMKIKKFLIKQSMK